MAISQCDARTDTHGRELRRHGTPEFPAASYRDDLAREPVPWHWHTALEVLAALEGDAVIAAGTERYTLHPGEGFFINSGLLHAAWAGEGQECRFHSIVFHPRLVGGGADSVFWQNYVGPLIRSTSLKALCFNCTEPWHREAVRDIRDAWTACAEEPPGYEFQVRNALSHLVYLLTRHCPPDAQPPAKKALRDESRIKTMLQYIHEHYEGEISTASIASSAAVSESECLRCFRSTIDMPPMQYVKEFRLKKAAELLAATRRGAAEIGAQCGFLDASYFSKAFREWAGCTPTEYRKKTG